jgi:LysM repeat protein
MISRISGWTVCLALLVTLPAAGCNRDGDASPPATSPSPSAVAVAPASPSPSPSPERETYTVKSGDTLWEIAERFDTTVEAIVRANDLDDPDVLSIGDKLVIPPNR